jgi:hypothetical protein
MPESATACSLRILSTRDAEGAAADRPSKRRLFSAEGGGGFLEDLEAGSERLAERGDSAAFLPLEGVPTASSEGSRFPHFLKNRPTGPQLRSSRSLMM